MGAVDEVGKVAGGFIDSMKTQPLSLALVAMNICLLAFFYMLLITIAAQREREIGLLYADKKEVREMLAKCVVPDPNRRTETDTHIDQASMPQLPPIRPLPEDLFKQPP